MTRNALKLGVAATIGVIATFGFFNSTASLRKKLRQSQSYVPILVAAEYLERGEALTQKNTLVREIPASALPPGLLTEQKNLVDDEGNPFFRVKGPFLKGEFISLSRLQDKRVALSLAWRLDKGKTASTFRFSLPSAVGGHLAPGDWVGVLATLEAQEEWGPAKSKVILPRVRVLGVNENLWEAWNPSGPEKSNRSSLEEETLITLSLEPVQAARLRLAEKKGDLSLYLLSPAETNLQTGSPVTLQSLRRN